jgi:hypothetical protein
MHFKQKMNKRENVYFLSSYFAINEEKEEIQ